MFRNVNKVALTTQIKIVLQVRYQTFLTIIQGEFEIRHNHKTPGSSDQLKHWVEKQR
jgi:hypothetical protein